MSQGLNSNLFSDLYDQLLNGFINLYTLFPKIMSCRMFSDTTRRNIILHKYCQIYDAELLGYRDIIIVGKA